MKSVDLVGITYGKLTVMSYVDPVDRTIRSRGSVWLCTCNCGVTCEVRGDKLVSGRRRSCGSHVCRYIDQCPK